jgi:vacuolar protein sorting-associated protein IST1
MQSTDPPPASVPPRILSKLALYTPPKELVDAYLGEIAKSYGVPFEAAKPMEPLEEDKEDTKGDEDNSAGPGEGQEKEENKALEPAATTSEASKKTEESSVPIKKDGGAASLPDLPSTAPGQDAPPKKVNEDDELAKRFERLKNLR